MNKVSVTDGNRCVADGIGIKDSLSCPCITMSQDFFATLRSSRLSRSAFLPCCEIFRGVNS